MAVKRANSSRVTPAPWWPRFWAWLIDTIIVGIVVGLIFPGPNFTNWNDMVRNANFYESALKSFIFFIYWAILENQGMQSIGKKAMRLKLVTVSGKNADISKSAVSAFGKAFLLPLDMIIGVLARPGRKQRLFNIASDTVVVRVKK
jgi:uncharacterized RDD family membrane protein YckC